MANNNYSVLSQFYYRVAPIPVSVYVSSYQANASIFDDFGIGEVLCQFRCLCLNNVSNCSVYWSSSQHYFFTIYPAVATVRIYSLSVPAHRLARVWVTVGR